MLPFALNFSLQHPQREHAVNLEEQSPAGLEVIINFINNNNNNNNLFLKKLGG